MAKESSKDRLTVHVFDNGVKVFAHYLIDQQRARYASVNRHEPVEEEWIEKLCRRASSSPFRFWDVGAGIGYYSLLVGTIRRDSVITTFEPLAKHAHAIERHRILNQLPDGKITVHQLAIAKISGQGMLADLNFGSVLVDCDDPALLTHPVKTASIDDLIGADCLDVIKVDVQGLELEVIQGARQAVDRIKSWVVGTHGDAVHMDCHRALMELGYTIEFSQPNVASQPDGLIVACRLGAKGN